MSLSTHISYFISQLVEVYEDKYSQCFVLHFPSSIGSSQCDNNMFPQRQSWPIDMLKSTAEYIVKQSSFVTRTHGLPNFTNANKPFVKGSQLTNAVVADICLEEKEFYTFYSVNPNTRDVEGVTLLQLIPVTKEEYTVKRSRGYETIASAIQWGSGIDHICRTDRRTADLSKLKESSDSD